MTRKRFYGIPCQTYEGDLKQLRCKVHLGDIVRIVDDFYVYTNPHDKVNKYFGVKNVPYPIKDKNKTKWLVAGMVRMCDVDPPCQSDIAFLLRNYKGEECVCSADAFCRLSSVNVLDRFPQWQEKRDKFVIPLIFRP